MYNIGFYSPIMQSGKSTSLNYLKDKYGYQSVVLARTLKRMVGVFLEDLGYSCDKIQRMIYGDLKEYIIPEIGKTTRELMISLGSSWGRTEVHPDIWVIIATRNLNSEINYISDDIRYENEYLNFKKAGFKIVRIENPRIPIVKSECEGNLEDFEFDYKILNDSTLSSLYSKLGDMITYFGG